MVPQDTSERVKHSMSSLNTEYLLQLGLGRLSYI